MIVPLPKTLDIHDLIVYSVDGMLFVCNVTLEEVQYIEAYSYCGQDMGDFSLCLDSMDFFEDCCHDFVRELDGE